MVDEAEREESDHLPIVVTVKSSETENDKLSKEKGKDYGKECLGGRGIEKYHKK